LQPHIEAQCAFFGLWRLAIRQNVRLQQCYCSGARS
jgi:hypothetical protein